MIGYGMMLTAHADAPFVTTCSELAEYAKSTVMSALVCLVSTARTALQTMKMAETLGFKFWQCYRL